MLDMHALRPEVSDLTAPGGLNYVALHVVFTLRLC
jgi:hypothetical protein